MSDIMSNKWIIFLDIDGVLNYMDLIHQKIPMARNIWKRGTAEDNTICQSLIRNLNRVVEETDSKVVLSSSWRIIYDLDFMNTFLQRHGATFKIEDYTPNARGIRIRGDEIKQYLIDNELQDSKRYVIIDDDSDMLDEQKANFFQIDPRVGLIENDVNEILKFMGDS